MSYNLLFVILFIHNIVIYKEFVYKVTQVKNIEIYLKIHQIDNKSTLSKVHIRINIMYNMYTISILEVFAVN